MTLEKRSFALGYLAAAYSMNFKAPLPILINSQCKKLNMTPLSDEEIRETTEFMALMLRLMQASNEKEEISQ